jgi:anti-sigma factor RsiW
MGPCIFWLGRASYEMNRKLSMKSSHITDEKLIAYASEELDKAELKIVRNHIAHCLECRLTTVSFKAISGLLRDDNDQAPPPSTVTRAHAIFRSSKPHSKRIRTLPYWILIFQSLSRCLIIPIVTVLA